MTTGQGTGYQRYLMRAFESRSKRNASYSMRAFARDLGMSPSKLSEVLRRRCGISPQSSKRIAPILGLSPEETTHFVSLVEAAHARSRDVREAARARAEQYEASVAFHELSLDRFKVMSGWHYFAILELTVVEDFEPHPEWIADRLGISAKDAAASIQTLLNLGMLTRQPDGGLTATEAFSATPSGIPSQVLREHHRQVLLKATESLERDPIEARDFSEITMAVDSRRMEEARQWLKEFRRKFCKDLGTSSTQDRVYCLAIQFFPVDLKSRGAEK